MNKMILLLLALLPTGQSLAQDPAPKPNEAALRQLLVQLIPSGLTVSNIKFDGMRATISGRSPDNTRVSDFLRNIERSPVMEMPELQQILRVGDENEFVLTTLLQCPTADDAAFNPCKTAAQSGATKVYKCTIDGVVTFQSSPCPAE